MAKAVALTPDALDAPAITPQAATPARRAVAKAVPEPSAVKPRNDKPLQIRVPQAEFRAIKIAATQHDQTVSEFMLACFHAFMKDGKHAR
jgi:hypothetical protein